MMRCEPSAVRRVGLVGGGVIGSGWAAHFLRRGMDVVVFDPGPGSENHLRRRIDEIWPTLERLGLEPGASPNRLDFTTRLRDAVAEVDVIQESSPENLERKVRLFEELDAATPADVALLSSTSGLAMTDIQVRCRHPERTVVGHPFNPPYLIPLVEVVGGAKSAPEAVAWAAAFYRAAGKFALELRRELPGFIANRLQDAMWREALHMIGAGEATVEEIDAAITNGPGLRWPIMGPCLTFHLAGGPGGMTHMLDHMGPSLKEPWTRLKAPPLTPELRARVIEGCQTEAGDRSIADLERHRDACLVAILEMLRR